MATKVEKTKQKCAGTSNEQGGPDHWLQMNGLSFRNKRLKLKTLAESPIVLEEYMKSTSN
jgi:hypothetical protein